MEKKDQNWAWGQIVDKSKINERNEMDNSILVALAQINQLKEMQIFCLRKEQELREQLTELGYNEYDEKLKEKRK
jgi:hypothetical protein